MPPATPLYTRDQVFNLVKSFSGQSNVIAVPRIFISLTGSASLALLLSQLLYWSERTTRRDRFVYKSNRDWFEEVGASRYDVDQFKTLPYVETKVKRANNYPTTHYRLRIDVLVDEMMALLEKNTPILDEEEEEEDLAEMNTDPAKICTPLCENSHTLMQNFAQPLVENNKSLTKITTKTTTDSLKDGTCAPEGARPPEKASSVVKKKSKDKPQSKPEEPSAQWEMMRAISTVTSYELKFKDVAAQVGRIAKQILAGGYTVQDVLDFETYWQENDWRWKKDKRKPTPADILKDIPESKKSMTPINYEEIYAQRRAAALKELEDYRKQLEQNAASQTGESEEVENAAL